MYWDRKWQWMHWELPEIQYCRGLKGKNEKGGISREVQQMKSHLPEQGRCSRSVVSDSLRPHGSQHARPPCPSPAPGVYSNSCPLSRWCHTTISSSVIPFSSCLQSLPASGSFQISQLFTSGGQSIGFSFIIRPSNEHSGLISFRWTGWISLQSKGLLRVFSNTTVQKHQFLGAQLSL